MEMIVFSIDKAHDLHTQAKFLRHLSNRKAMGEMLGEVQLCIGKYEGVLEPSFLMLSVDFNKHVRGTT
jgi:hypothetical protein